jgi:hypothetical protein
MKRTNHHALQQTAGHSTMLQASGRFFIAFLHGDEDISAQKLGFEKQDK